MSTADDTRSNAAIELADALLSEFNNPSSALKGIGVVTMEKLLLYSKIAERAQRKKLPPRSRRAPAAAESDSENDADS